MPACAYVWVACGVDVTSVDPSPKCHLYCVIGDPGVEEFLASKETCSPTRASSGALNLATGNGLVTVSVVSSVNSGDARLSVWIVSFTLQVHSSANLWIVSGLWC